MAATIDLLPTFAAVAEAELPADEEPPPARAEATIDEADIADAIVADPSVAEAPVEVEDDPIEPQLEDYVALADETVDTQDVQPGPVTTIQRPAGAESSRAQAAEAVVLERQERANAAAERTRQARPADRRRQQHTLQEDE